MAITVITTKAILGLAVCLSATSLAQSQCQLSVASTSQGNNTTVYTYTINATTACSAPKLHLPVARAYSVPAPPATNWCSQGYDVTNGEAVIFFGSACSGVANAASYSFELLAPADLTAPYTSSTQFTLASTEGTVSDFIQVPTDRSQIPVVANPVGNPGTLDLLVGAGSHFSAVPANYSVDSTTNALSASGVGVNSPVLLVGIGFNFNPTSSQFNKRHPWAKYVPNTAFVNLQISPTSETNTLNGYTIGPAWKIQQYLEVTIGYSLAPVNSPSAGFLKAAAQVVQNNPTVPLYQRYSATDILANVPGALDGFPLSIQNANGSTGTPVFPGSPLTTRYQNGFFVGVAFPINLLKNLPGAQ